MARALSTRTHIEAREEDSNTHDQTAYLTHLQVIAVIHIDSLQVKVSSEWEEHSARRSTIEHGQSMSSCDNRAFVSVAQTHPSITALLAS